jgi:hypothetical protein
MYLVLHAPTHFNALKSWMRGSSGGGLERRVVGVEGRCLSHIGYAILIRAPRRFQAKPVVVVHGTVKLLRNVDLFDDPAPLPDLHYRFLAPPDNQLSLAWRIPIQGGWTA